MNRRDEPDATLYLLSAATRARLRSTRHNRAHMPVWPDDGPECACPYAPTRPPLTVAETALLGAGAVLAAAFWLARRRPSCDK